MAFGFIKKVFSFGRKEEPAVEAEQQAPPPVGTAAPEPQPAVFEEATEPTPPPPEPRAPVEEAVPEGIADQTRDLEADERERLSAKAEEAALPPDVPSAEAGVADQTEDVEALAEEAEEETPPAAEPMPSGDQVATPDISAEILPPLREPPPTQPEPVLGEIAPEPAPVSPSPPPKKAPAVKVTVGEAVERRREPIEAAAPAPTPRTSWLQRLRSGLSRSSKELGDNLSSAFVKHTLTPAFVEELEEVLIRADLGMDLAMRVTDVLESGKYGRNTTEADVRRVMAEEIEKVLAPVAIPLELDLSHSPHVILVVGVNGTGKTTTIGKLAAKLTAGGLKVTLAAGDTFRAAAIEQLKIWGERTNSPVVASRLGADAAGLAYEAFEQAKATGSDVLIIDTAGRLQNRAELMAELEKIVRVLKKLDPQAPHTVLQTVDATTGQNALNQVEIFRNVAGVNGLVMTKLDGTARGGILVAIAGKHRLPVYFIGVGEQVDDLEPFSAGDFARAIAGVI